MAGDWKNKLYFGDNLDIMREHILKEGVGLIYLDRPFNSKATYPSLSSGRQIHINVRRKMPEPPLQRSLQ